MTMHIGRPLLLGAVVAAALSAAAAFLLLGDNGASAGAASGRAQAASADVTAHFSVLSRPLTGAPADALGSYVEANTLAGFNPDLARRVSPDPRSKMWVAPADGDAICLVDTPIISPRELPAAHCHTLADALEGKTVAVAGSAPEVEIRGLVPDGAKQVVVHLVGGSSAIAPVRENAYDLIVDKATVSISFSDGQSTTDLSAPSIDGPAAEG
jgi:hypothetical protein